MTRAKSKPVSLEDIAYVLEQMADEQAKFMLFWDEPRSDYASGRHDAHEVAERSLRARAAKIRAAAEAAS